MQAHPRRSASAKGGTSPGGWLPATPPARRSGSEIRAPDTLVEAIITRLRTRVRFPPSPLFREPRDAGLSAFSGSISVLRYRHRVVPGDVIDQAGRRIAAAARTPARVVLFGSHARGDAGPDSDLDFLVIEQDVEDRHGEMVRLGRVVRSLGVPIDIVVVSEAYVAEWADVEGSMVHAALTEGRELDAAA
jgi:predicted nucleotidyltransferase